MYVDTQAEKYFDRVSESLAGIGVNQVEVRVLHGHPAEAIASLSQEATNNLIAMTSHGRSGVGRWVLGSVVERVIRSCGNPLLLVRAVQTATP
jgi:nucleotide-binding universal stress UspA family protein